MLESIIRFSLRNKLIILLFTFSVAAFGVYSLTQISIGAVPDITNNQVQVITTSRNLSTQDVEQFITYPVELEMANLPGVEEIRSISKFGLSVVTIVFEDKMGTYLPRQLIAEKIKSASEKIPEAFGSPEMGPISTGLGEIYQYIIDVEPAYKDQYSAMDLRTIQDWIVKRQLSGIPGVVEVNAWGGFLKQYQVEIDPLVLQSMNISALVVSEAIEKNNSVSGGSYIEKGDQSFFIRGEGRINGLEDIGNIVVETRDQVPVFVKDIAKVTFGFATRFGATTGNGEGEKVLGQVMMLKDANSNKVIEAVKQRVEEIGKTLPEGVFINPVVERSGLIARTTATIAENLILGCLIVIFVVMLLLGNIRSGLVVASLIPLSLLFAISLMYVFGIDANLMSLGAIDFGIIIDGAVIIVEYVAYQVSKGKTEYESLDTEARKTWMDEVTLRSTTKMIRSAIFGQIIIIIVFIPILTLTNVEGKMFIPMALTFCFALMGAMILGFTFIPVAASYFIKPDSKQLGISTWLIAFLNRIYEPVLSFSIAYKKLVISFAGVLILYAAWLFSTMGGEFVPTLDEGDFVIQPVIPTGTSLSRTVEITTEIEKIILTFPEVNQAVSRIGAAEVPTDPMSMEESDVIISLKDKSEWPSKSKDELADQLKEALLTEMPDMEFEFTQPIEMRFNELITGVRADLAIKIFGEDLDILYAKSLEIEALVKDVPGASDVIVEKTDGLPQIQVKYDRERIARYGLNIQEVNRHLSLAFAGEVVGIVFEGEKQFDLVVKYSPEARKDIRNIENIYVPLANGSQVPLSVLADVFETVGPAKISRDDTRRRNVVSVNVRNRDLESVVKDVQMLIEANIGLPPGYSVSYGGQFENLQNASKRLMLAVPIALVLIFIILHFAFGSLKEVLIIYSAIPLSAVGGVTFLWLRDMPFSISAGVGFIALFGIAVLNGIVMIEHFRSLKKQGNMSITEIVFLGAKQRLRPVLLTASAAAMGFLPMAFSNSAGAEVQRPLATVVIGGLLTATLLTLVVLPVLYSIFEKSDLKLKGGKVLLILIMIWPATVCSQGTKVVSLHEAIDIAKVQNLTLRAKKLSIEKEESLSKSAYDFNKTNFYYNFDQNNLSPDNEALKIFGVEQSFAFPTVYTHQSGVNKNLVEMRKYELRIEERALEKQISLIYYEIDYLLELQMRYNYLDSIYLRFEAAAQRKYELGEYTYLEQLTAQSLMIENKKKLNEVNGQLLGRKVAFQNWLQLDSVEIQPLNDKRLVLDQVELQTLPSSQLYQKSILLSDRQVKLQRSKTLPDINLEYFQGKDGVTTNNYQGFQVGLSIPVFYTSHRAKVVASKLELEYSKLNAEKFQVDLTARHDQLMAAYNSQQSVLNYYDQSGKKLSTEILKAANRSFESGEINFFQYIQSLDRATQSEIGYLLNVWAYNKTVIEINYISL
ncbi:MAG: CusA/CzcA family heavy metal efflux RND transporter [Reichenbachiella sp.]